MSLVIVLNVQITSLSHMLYEEAYHLSLTFLGWSNLLLGICLVIIVLLLLILISKECFLDRCCLVPFVDFEMVVI
jgi:hypothetical protein